MAGILWNPAWIPFAQFNEAFLWIPSLAKPDPTYVLPLLSGFFQFIQSRMSLPIRDPNQPLDSQTKMMQTMMQFMPLYIILISINFASGTVLYWAMSNVFGAVQQYFITGFGSLPTLPFMGWLPRKAPQIVTTPPPPPPSLEGKPAKQGLMMRMMGKAVEAQQVQKTTQTELDEQPQTEIPRAEQRSNGTAKPGRNGKSASANGARKEKPRVEQSGDAGEGESEEPQVKIVPTSSAKYASDLKYRRPEPGNGARHDELSSTYPSVLPRKKRGKR